MNYGRAPTRNPVRPVWRAAQTGRRP